MPDLPVLGKVHEFEHFDDPGFKLVKDAVKAALNQDQAGLCAYCERQLLATVGQVDHIKPKGGKHGRPDLCFTYTNFSHSCISNKICGQKKSAGLLPIEPGPGCNQQLVYSTTDASIQKLWQLMKYTWMSVKCRDSKMLEKDVGDILDNFGIKYKLSF